MKTNLASCNLFFMHLVNLITEVTHSSCHLCTTVREVAAFKQGHNILVIYNVATDLIRHK